MVARGRAAAYPPLLFVVGVTVMNAVPVSVAARFKVAVVCLNL